MPRDAAPRAYLREPTVTLAIVIVIGLLLQWTTQYTAEWIGGPLADWVWETTHITVLANVAGLIGWVGPQFAVAGLLLQWWSGRSSEREARLRAEEDVRRLKERVEALEKATDPPGSDK